MKKKLIRRSAFIAVTLFVIMLAGCSSTEEQIKFVSNDKDFEIQLQEGYVKKDVTESQDPKGYVYAYERDGEVLNISEFLMPGTVLDETMIDEEIGLSTEMEVLRKDNVDLGEKGKFYGVLVNDTTTGMYMMYHRIQKGDKIISFLNFKSIPYTVEEEASYKAMISTIEFK
ncbi:MAG: hypothetical protein WBH44_03210 [Proteocatella sp.]